MVQLSNDGFFSSVDLLGPTCYPDSTVGYPWLHNKVPNAGGHSECVATKVLSSFSIPYKDSLTPIPLCVLPGYDINNMDAIAAIKLSLAAFLSAGKYIDLTVDGDGTAVFYEVYPSPKKISLSVRMCIPTTTLDNTAKMVIVRGYDPPPTRVIRPGKAVIEKSKLQGNMTPYQVGSSKRTCLLSETDAFSSVKEEVTCEGRPYQRVAVVSYPDPVLESAYGDQNWATALYNPKAFESVVGYIIKFISGHNDRDVTYQASSTTSVTYSVPFGGLTQQGQICAVIDSGGTESVKFGYEKILVDPVEVVDRYNQRWPIFLGVSGLQAIGNTIHAAIDYRSSYDLVKSGKLILYVDSRVLRLSPPINKNWHWVWEGNKPVIYIYSPQFKDDTSISIWDLLAGASQSDITMHVYGTDNIATAYTTYLNNGIAPNTFNPQNAGGIWPVLGAGIGTYVQSLAVTVDIDRPSMLVNDPKGNAKLYADMLEVIYYPIVMVDNPAPVAFKSSHVGSGVIKHELDLTDNDPTTVQPDPSEIPYSNAWLSRNTEGNTVDVSLPFLQTEQECLATAEMLYDLHSNFGSGSILSYSLVCGPDDEPELGAQAEGFDSNLRINEISYSYQDGSSYNINVTLGPVYQGLGSWNTSMWQRKTETVTREGIIIWGRGDGCTYRVRVQGIGDYWAINTTLDTYFPGEKVQVRLYNNPVEK